MTEELSSFDRYMLSIIGSLLPSVMEVYRMGLLELETLITNAANPDTFIYYMLGFAFRVIIIILAACLYCYFFNEEEQNKLKIFFDGIAAPSMLIMITQPITQLNAF